MNSLNSTQKGDNQFEKLNFKGLRNYTQNYTRNFPQQKQDYPKIYIEPH